MSATASHAVHAFDARPLTEPVDKRAVRTHKEELRRRFGKRSRTSGAAVVLVVFAAVIILAIGGTLTAVVVAIVSDLVRDGHLSLPVVVLALVVVAAGLATLITSIARHTSDRAYRLDHFARANAMSYHPGIDDPQLPGMIFRLGRSRRSSSLVRGEQPRFVEFGDYQYTTGSGKNSTTHRWGYIAVRLDAPLPHIVLDSERNNSIFGSNLPTGFRRDQRLSLEGDFDSAFSLYCPEGYEADALYLFTPDIMQRFVDRASLLDIEIVDDWLFFYLPSGAISLDPRRWAWMFGIVGAMLDKLAQWGRWRDDRLAAAAPVTPDHVEAPALQSPPMVRPPRGVAQPGRRLRTRRTGWVIVIVAAAAWIAFQILRSIIGWD